MNAKYKLGDRVKVVIYGHPYVRLNNGKLEYGDMLPEIIGKIGIVARVTETQGKTQYALDGVPEKYAWYDETQLRLVKKKQIA